MAVLTGDRRFEESANEAVKKGASVTMCDVLDRAENRGIEKGLARGKAEGLAKGKAEGLARGKAEGRLYTLIELALDGVLSRAEAAARANLSEQEFVKKAEEYRRPTGPSQPFPQ